MSQLLTIFQGDSAQIPGLVLVEFVLMLKQPKVVSTNEFDSGSEQTRLTEHLWKEWKTSDSELKKLAKEEDRLISEGLDVSEDLEAEIDEICELQRKIVLDALSIRSETLEDIAFKLEIWQSWTFGEKVKPHLLQPGDLLVRQTIREFKELQKKAS